MPHGEPSEPIARAIRALAARLGFDRVGFCDAAPPAEAARFDRWLAAGHHAGMEWLASGRDRRLDPSQVLKGARSLVVAALAYARPSDPGREEMPATAGGAPRDGSPPRGRVARYALGDDYHRVMGERLVEIEDLIEREAPGERALAYVDTGPFLERLWAARAGIGWVGKNALVLNKEMGSWFLLGIVVTTLRLPPDRPAPDHCGSCSLCIEACPTGAIVEPRVVDSRRCLSYHTIELRGPIPEEHRNDLGARVFGCDDCQEACPWNHTDGPATSPGLDPALAPRAGSLHPPLLDLLRLTHAAYLERFRDSAMKRATWRGLRRNAAIALGSSAAATGAGRAGAERLAAELEEVAASEDDPMVREAASWAARAVRKRTTGG